MFSGQEAWHSMEKVLDGAKSKTSGKVAPLKAKAFAEERLLHFKVLVFWAKCLDVSREIAGFSKTWISNFGNCWMFPFSGHVFLVWMGLVFDGEIAG